MCDIVIFMNNFGNWLSQELTDRGWSMSELGRRCNVTHATISRIISGDRKPSLDLCKEIAHAFSITPEEVMRQAGLLPAVPGEDLTFRQILEIARSMTVEQRRDALQYVLYLYRQDRKREADEKKKKKE